MKIAFIGGGKMAEAMIARLKSYKIIVSDVDPKRLAALDFKFKLKTTFNNQEAFDYGEVVVLAVKPQQVGAVLAEVGSSESGVRSRKLVISIAAGIPLRYIEKKLPGAAVVRAMPNNPALVGKGITAIAKGKKVGSRELRVGRVILEAIGEVVEVPERYMDAVTGLSGSGPAFVYEAIEGLIDGGVACGLPPKLAEKLALRTIVGAVETVEQTAKPPQVLKAMVTSPGGTTIEGLKVLEKFELKRAKREAVIAATKKAKELARRWTA